MTLTPKQAAAGFWDKVYEGNDFAFGREPNAWFASKASYLKKGQRILMVADGEGRNSIWCAQKGLVVDAFDLSAKGIEKARHFALESGVKVNFTVAGVDDWDWEPNAYDAVTLILCQFATPSMRKKLFADCIKTLKTGGLFFVLGYTVKQLEYGTGGPPNAAQLYTEAMLRDLVQGMAVLELESFDMEVSAGRHRGKSAFVGLVSCKK
ncbi:MAG: class I SAM-dependent methyltransferase [Oxalobacter sp.]|nr:class I SAM-dependent methyltransferase [Oxalobacter sp.]